MNRIIRRLFAIAVIPAAALALSACSDNSGMDHGAPGSTPMMSGAHATADVEFAQMMIVHHQQAVEMAELAETRASDSEVKQLAAQIKAAQQPEIDLMTGWLNAWGQPTASSGGHGMPGMGDMPGLMSEQEMAQLEAASGSEFDKMFATMMIAHHNGAIQMADDVLANGTDADVKTLATNIKTSQSAEVEQLQMIIDRL